MLTKIATQSLALLLSATLLFALSACGFKLRGNIAVAPQFQQLQLNADPNSQFTRALIDQLTANNIQLTASAPMHIHIREDALDKRTISYSGRGKSAEYEIIRRVSFEILKRDQQDPIIPYTELESRRTYLYDDTKVAAMSEQEALIKEELAFDLAAKLLMRLQKQK